MIKELAKLATHLDARGLRKEADYLDRIITKLSNDNEISSEVPLMAGSAAGMAGVAGVEATVTALSAGAIGAAAIGVGAAVLAGYTAGFGIQTAMLVDESNKKADLIFFDNVLKRALSDVLRRMKGSMGTDQVRSEHSAMMKGQPSKNLLENLRLSDVNRHYDSLKSSASNVSEWNEDRYKKMKEELFDKVLKQ